MLPNSWMPVYANLLQDEHSYKKRLAPAAGGGGNTYNSTCFIPNNLEISPVATLLMPSRVNIAQNLEATNRASILFQRAVSVGQELNIRSIGSLLFSGSNNFLNELNGTFRPNLIVSDRPSLTDEINITAVGRIDLNGNVVLTQILEVLSNGSTSSVVYKDGQAFILCELESTYRPSLIFSPAGNFGQEINITSRPNLILNTIPITDSEVILRVTGTIGFDGQLRLSPELQLIVDGSTSSIIYKDGQAFILGNLDTLLNGSSIISCAGRFDNTLDVIFVPSFIKNSTLNTSSEIIMASRPVLFTGGPTDFSSELVALLNPKLDMGGVVRFDELLEIISNLTDANIGQITDPHIINLILNIQRSKDFTLLANITKSFSLER
jgi:hypothetical protein